MPTQIQRRRGTTAQHSTFTGAAGELTVDTDKKTVVVHDGSTAGGAPLLRENGSQNAVTTGTSTAASFIPTSSTAPTNGVYLPAANSVAISTNGSQRVTVDSSGNVGIGTGSPSAALHVQGATPVPTIEATGAFSGLSLQNSGGSTKGFVFVSQSGGVGQIRGESIAFTNADASTERGRWDSSGRLLVGTSSAVGTTSGTGLIVRSITSANHPGEILLQNGYSLPGDGSELGSIKFQDAAGSTYAKITGNQNGTASSSSDVPGMLVMSTTPDSGSSPVERLRIQQNGFIQIGTGGSAPSTSVPGIQIGTPGFNFWSSYNSGTGAYNQFVFGNANGLIGSISTNGSATGFNTSSDYRLKENVAAVTDGITRLQQLKPSRFNFISDPDRTVDGFIAHEVQAVVPEAITGEKDAVDDEGNPVYQGIDQSKLVPLLTAALQEAIGRIETLESEVAALKAQ